LEKKRRGRKKMDRKLTLAVATLEGGELRLVAAIFFSPAHSQHFVL
jgi:hypothetical protein